MTEATTEATNDTENNVNASILESATTTAQEAAKTATTAAQDAAKTAATAAQDAAKTVADTSASLYTQAREAIGQAVETTIEAVKEHPIAAAAIGAGVAATVAGAALGVSKLLEDEPAETGKSKAKA